MSDFEEQERAQAGRRFGAMAGSARVIGAGPVDANPSSVAQRAQRINSLAGDLRGRAISLRGRVGASEGLVMRAPEKQPAPLPTHPIDALQSAEEALSETIEVLSIVVDAVG